MGCACYGVVVFFARGAGGGVDGDEAEGGVRLEEEDETLADGACFA
jgi:hypothetical protein